MTLDHCSMMGQILNHVRFWRIFDKENTDLWIWAFHSTLMKSWTLAQMTNGICTAEWKQFILCRCICLCTYCTFVCARAKHGYRCICYKTRIAAILCTYKTWIQAIVRYGEHTRGENVQFEDIKNHVII